MSESKPDNHEKSEKMGRRALLKALAATGAALAVDRLLPGDWTTPTAQAVTGAQPTTARQFVAAFGQQSSMPGTAKKSSKDNDDPKPKGARSSKKKDDDDESYPGRQLPGDDQSAGALMSGAGGNTRTGGSSFSSTPDRSGNLFGSTPARNSAEFNSAPSFGNSSTFNSAPTPRSTQVQNILDDVSEIAAQSRINPNRTFGGSPGDFTSVEITVGDRTYQVYDHVFTSGSGSAH